MGSGAGGLSAAVTAAHLGLKVLVVEELRRYHGLVWWLDVGAAQATLAVAAGIVEEDITQPLLSYLKHDWVPGMTRRLLAPF